jgi:holin-like protein
MVAIFLLIALQLVGDVIVTVTGLPVPGAVIGLVLLYVILSVRGGASEEMTHTTGFLLDNLALLFVPAGVGVIAYLPLIVSRWEVIVAALLVSVTVTIGLTALTVSWLARRSAATTAESTP